MSKTKFHVLGHFDNDVQLPPRPNPTWISLQELEDRILAHENVLVTFRAPHNKLVRNAGLYFKPTMQGRLRYERLEQASSYEQLEHRIRRYTNLPYRISFYAPGHGKLPPRNREGQIVSREVFEWKP